MILLGAVAAIGAAPPKPVGQNSIATVSLYSGAWRTHIVHYKTKYSRARVETSMLKNDCWRSEGYFACDQIVDGISRALLVFTYDDKSDIFHSHVIPVEGAASTGTLVVKANVWTFPWEDKDGSRAVHLRVVNTFLSDDEIQYRQEYSFDRLHWVVTATGDEQRVK